MVVIRVCLNIFKIRLEKLITDSLIFLNRLNMKSASNYLNFLKEKGKPLSEINPGSDEIALTVEDALKALELIKDSKEIILGGDILSEENNELIYAYQFWGEEYHCLNWYCNKANNESEESYLKRSYITAEESIINANKTACKLRKKCYIVFICGNHTR
jgi:hypothetical protein